MAGTWDIAEEGGNLLGVAGPGDRAGEGEGGPICKGWQGLGTGQGRGVQSVRGGRAWGQGRGGGSNL